jgi:hypothetical protein
MGAIRSHTRRAPGRVEARTAIPRSRSPAAGRPKPSKRRGRRAPGRRSRAQPLEDRGPPRHRRDVPRERRIDRSPALPRCRSDPLRVRATSRSPHPSDFVQALGQSAQRLTRLDVDQSGVDAATASGAYAQSQRTRSGAAGARSGSAPNRSSRQLIGCSPPGETEDSGFASACGRSELLDHETGNESSSGFWLVPPVRCVGRGRCATSGLAQISDRPSVTGES